MKNENGLKLVKNAPEKGHATYSASGSEIWLECQGSIQLSKKAPPKVSSAAGSEGTRAHECLEFLINNRHQRGKAIQFLEKKYPRSMIIHAEMALDYIEKRHREVGGELHSEIRCDLPVSEPGQYGTTDGMIAAHFDRLIIIDFKYGVWPVEADENSQMLYYAVSKAHEYEYNFDKCELVIIQPRAQIDGEFIRSWECDMDTLREWREKFEAGIQASKKKNPPLNPGNWCHFCQAAPICPKLKDDGFKKAALDFDDNLPAETKLPAVNTKAIPFKKLPEVLEGIEKLEKWIKAVKHYAEGFLAEGGKVTGWGLVPKRPTTVWNDEAKVIRLAKRTWTDGSAFEPEELKSPAQIKKMGVKGKTFVELHTSKVSSGVKLGRPHANVAQDFDDDI